MTSFQSTDPRIERAAKIVAGVATAWFALAVTWGLFARVGGGHEAVIATRSIVAENMRLWHMVEPVKDYTFQRPTIEMFYVHHPWGMFWLCTAFADVLGRGTWVPRLVAVLMSIATPPLLYGIGRALWGPVAGAISALAYVVLPITLAFGNLPGFEVPIIFSCLLATYGYLRFTQRWQRRWMLVSVLGFLLASNSDWEAAVFTGTVLGCLAVGRLALGRWFGRARMPQFAEWWILVSLVSALSLLGYVVYFQHLGVLEDLIHSETQRARGDQISLSEVLRIRSYWIDVTFTPLAVTIGKIAAPIFIARVLVWRRLHEVFPLALLLMAVLQYVKLKNGADIHIFWPMPFAPYWALSMGMLSAATMALGARLLKWRRRSDKQGFVAVVVLGLFCALAVRILPDGIRGLRYAKATAGRFNENGKRIYNDVDLSEALEWMAERMAPHTPVAMAKELASREYRGQEWALHRPIVGVPAPAFLTAGNTDHYFVGDLRFLSSDDQKRMTKTFHVVTLGPYFLVDRRDPPASLDAFTFDERAPGFYEWYFAHPSEPVRTVRPNAWTTWELRDHYEQTPNPPPAAPPADLDEIRIAHNVAVATGDMASAHKWEAKLVAALDTKFASRPDGVRLMGKRFVPGVDPKLDLYFLADGPLPTDAMFEVVSSVDAPPAMSLVPADIRVKQYGSPFVIAPRLWHKGYIYVEHVDLRLRPGREYFSGYFDTQGAQSMMPGMPAHTHGVYLMTTP